MTKVVIDKELILPHFLPYIDAKETYQFFVGTAGSGKSHFIVIRALILAMREERFRLIFARKTHESIKDSQFQLFKDYIRAWDLGSIFQVKEQGMDIHCRNGNMLLSSGLDNEEKIKSIADPTHVWIEEMLGDKKSAAITRDDFNQLDIRLRGKKGVQLQMWGSYNPVNEKSWIKEDFHTDIMESEFIEKSKVDSCLIHWSNYRKNTFIDIDEYDKKLERIARSNPNTYRVYSLGQWGKPDVQRPFVSNFEYDKHVSEFALYQPNKQLYFSIDFNIDPFACIVSHQWTDSTGIHKHFFKEIGLNNGDIDEMCRKVKSLFPPMQLDSALWTGDATGHKRDLLTKNNMSAWLLLMKGLNIPPKRIKTPRSNPIVRENRIFVDYVFSQHPDLKFHPDMKTTINELQFTEADPEGNIIKKDRNKMEQRADYLDCFTGDTMILTIDGQKRIDKIKIGEYVLTRDGYKEVVDTWSSKAFVYEYYLSNNTTIKCTKGHKFYNNSVGYCEIQRIFAEKKTVCKIQSFTKAGNIESIISKSITTVQNIKDATHDHYIDKCGLITLEKFQKSTTYITLTMMAQIMILATLNVYIKAIILGCTVWKGMKRILNTLKTLLKSEGHLHQYGMDQKQVKNGIDNTQKKSDSDTLNMDSKIVSFADIISKRVMLIQDFAQINVKVHGEGSLSQTWVLRYVRSAERVLSGLNIIRKDFVVSHVDRNVSDFARLGIMEVYDITVKDSHEFYANNILVHNCLRYDLNTWSKQYFTNKGSKF